MEENSFRGEYSFFIQGHPYNVLINLNCLRIMCRDEGLKFPELDKYLTDNPFESIPKLIWYANQNWNLRNNREMEPEEFEMFCAKALDEPGLFERMSEMVTESLGDKEPEKKTRATRRKAAAAKK